MNHSLNSQYTESHYKRDISPVVNQSIFIIGIISFLVALFLFVLETPDKISLWVNILDFITMLTLFLLRKKLSMNFKAIFILSTLLIGVVANFLELGIFSTSLLILVGFITVTAILFPFKATVITVTLINIILASLFFILQQGFLFFPEIISFDLNNSVLWIPYLGTIMALSILMVLSINFLKTRLISNIIKREKTNNILKQKEKELEYLAYYDSLTGLPKQEKFIEKLTNLEKAGELNKGYILEANIKQFRTINNLLGPDIANDLLKSIGRTILPRVKDPNMVARLIGDEFIFWVEVETPNELAQFSQILDMTYSKKIFLENEDIPIEFHLSAALYDPAKKNSITVTVNNAGLTLKKARDSVDKSILFFEEKILDQARKEMALIRFLERDIEEKNFYLAYQEQVDIKTEKTVGLEALIRYTAPNGKTISPNIFVPIITKHNLIIPFGKMVCDLVLLDMEKIIKKYGDSITVSVNISPMLFLVKNFVAFIKDRLEAYKISGKKIILEITEDVFMEDTKTPNEKIEELKALGIKISLDDFGTGFSSLSQIDKINLDELKIDRSFIRNIENDTKKQKIINSICDIAKTLNYKIVAEGVETKEQLDQLRQTKCDIIQGFYFSKPKPLDFQHFYKEN